TRGPHVSVTVENVSYHSVAFVRSEEHTSELQSRLVISYAVFCLKKKKSSRPRAWRLDRRRFRRASAGEVRAIPYQQYIPTPPTPRAGAWLFFFNDTATTEIYTTRHTLSLHDALPI